MGSVLSFVILCLANLGLYLKVVEDDPRSLNKKLKGVLVNGDDMAYRAPESVFQQHVVWGKRVGLDMTPGKAYKHDRFVNANSTCFDVPEGSTPWQIDFLNVGLFFGQNKVMQKDTTLDETEISNKVSVINQLMKGALPGRRQKKELFMRYLALHRREIREECGWRNMFFHPSVGGMGVKPILGVKPRSTLNQRLSAAKLADIPGAVRDEGVLPGPLIPEVSGKTVPWQDVPKKDFRIPIVRTRGLLKTLRDHRGGRDDRYSFPIVQCSVGFQTRQRGIFERKKVEEVLTPHPLPFEFNPVGESYSDVRKRFSLAASVWAESCFHGIL